MKNSATEIAIHTIGLDIAKNNFSIHGFDVNGVTVLTKDLKRPQVLGWFAKLPSGGVRGLCLGALLGAHAFAAWP